MTWKNPLIDADSIDTLNSIENHLRFINDYIYRLCSEDDKDMRICDGVCSAVKTSIAALNHVIEVETVRTHQTGNKS